MVGLLTSKRGGPIGVDLGSRAIKLLQLSGDRTRVLDAVRHELPPVEGLRPEQQADRLTDALRQARQGREFVGRDAVLCLGGEQLYVQNIRVPKATGDELERIVHAEAEGKLPFSPREAEIRFVEAADVRQGDMTKREVVLLACHQPVLERILSIVVRAGLRPVAVDIEPAAVLRCYSQQFRRDEDKRQRTLLVHLGAASTAVVIAQGNDALFIKYVETSGRTLDEAVAKHLKLAPPEAAALRRQHADRQADRRDEEISRSLAEATRPVVDRLIGELSLCLRYHSVTFRGQPVARVILGGGEATPALAEALGARLDIPCEVGEPLRLLHAAKSVGRQCQWDVAAGLALRNIN